MSLQFWVTQYFRKTILLNNPNTILICNKKLSIQRKYPLVSHVSPNVEDGSLIYCIHIKPTKTDPHKSIEGFQVEPNAQVAFDCICYENPLSQRAILDGMSIIFCQSCINLVQFVCHFKLLAHMRQPSNMVLFSHSCWSVPVNFRSSPLHMSFSSSMYWNFNNILVSHNFLNFKSSDLGFDHTKVSTIGLEYMTNFRDLWTLMAFKAQTQQQYYSHLASIHALWILPCTLNSNWRKSLKCAKSTSIHPSVELRRLIINAQFLTN